MLRDRRASRPPAASRRSRTGCRARAPRRAPQDGSRVPSSFLRLEMRGGFLVNALPDFLGHWLARFLEDVTDEPDRARHDAQTFDDAPIEPQLAGERADRARGIQRDAARCGNLLHQAAVFAVVPGLARDLEEPHAARVDRLMDRVAEAGHALVLG